MERTYPCSYCEQQLTTLRGYVSHCRFHRNECNSTFPCPFPRCHRRNSSYFGLKSHIQRDHDRPTQRVNTRYRNLDVPLQCAIAFCEQICNDVQDFLKHLKEHLAAGTEVLCPFNNCDSSFSKKSSFTSHLSRNHKPDINDQIPADIVEVPVDVDDAAAAIYDNEPVDDLELIEETENTGDLYLKNLLLFYLQLESKYLLPASTIQNIIEQIQDIHSLGQSLILKRLQSRLTNDLHIPIDVVKELIEEIRASDLLVSCGLGPLRTDHCRKSTYKKKFDYVAPVTIALGRNASNIKRSFQYIPVKDSLENLFKNKSVHDQYQSTRYPNYHGYHRHDDEQAKDLCDITDGLAFKGNEFFQENPDALKLILYQDAFEVCNPLGSGKKKHKILAVYMTLANFSPHLRSSIDQTILVLLCTETDFKYFGQEEIFRPLIDDLKDLEINGIHISDTHLVKGSVCFISGDNLGSHCIGGFVENFSSTHYWCRWCLLSSAEFQQDPCAVGPTRTEEIYNSDLEELQNRPATENNVRGVKFDSHFNQLRFFHVCRGLPPCLGHDLFEGIVSYDVALILEYIIKEKKWLTYNELNRKISQFKYLGSDRNNRPNQVSPNSEKLGGQAVQNWCFVRLLPVLISDKIAEPDDAVWQLFLHLRDIVELVCAPKINEAQIAILSFTTDEYLEARHRLFPEKRMRPKHHYLKHYPGLILQFGPLIRTWTLRFESKHSYFKRCVRNLHNFINLCFTLAERHQLMQASRCAGSFFPVAIDANQAGPLYMDTYNDSIKDILMAANVTDADQVAYVLNYRGTTYRKGDYVLVGQDANGLLFGEVLFLVIRNNSQVYFVVRVHQSLFDFALHVFVLSSSDNRRSYMCLKANKLLDYYPLSAYGRRNARQIPLKHAVHYEFL